MHTCWLVCSHLFGTAKAHTVKQKVEGDCQDSTSLAVAAVGGTLETP